jgi:hypothetical protein
LRRGTSFRFLLLAIQETIGTLLQFNDASNRYGPQKAGSRNRTSSPAVYKFENGGGVRKGGKGKQWKILKTA